MKKTYILGMFPYPSGEGLHVGHVRIFTACDVMARYFRMKAVADPSTSSGSPSAQVLSPMGWDAFGLPAENAAIKAKKIPQEMVPHNYANFKKQMQNLSLSFDWEREFATTDPQYYAITQWIFLQLYGKKDEQGRRIVYREKVAINWCPKCLTGLANEEVLPDGTHERCGTVVGKKLLPQWVMRITSYAERLLNDLDVDLKIEGKKLDPGRAGLDWPKGILEMQRNWIGKKEGARVRFKVKGESSKFKSLEVFTTRIDTINGVTFVVVAPEVAASWIDNGWQASDKVVEYIRASLAKSEQSRLEGEKAKTGINTELLAINPYNQEEVPIYVADYVLSDFGTGAVMGVPQYDERDREFATKYSLPIRDLELDDYKKTLAKLKESGDAHEETTYHLRDWVFSRQRYWGEPIPLVYCEKCGDENGVVPVPEDQLPLELPTLDSYEPTETGESPLSRVTDWVNTTCPNCGGPATRETDTMPNWAGSCWYFLAFPFWAAKQSGEKINNLNDAKKYIKEWSPVDWYLGGAEHAVLHLLYARFWVKVLQDLNILDFPEPFLRLRSVGLVLAEDGKKMSKSIGNVVNPDDMVTKYGSDATRMYEMFMGPWEQSIAWDSGAISGQVRFLDKIRQAVTRDHSHKGDKVLKDFAGFDNQYHWTIKRVGEGILDQKFNTSIAEIMKLVNRWNHAKDTAHLSDEAIGDFLKILSPFAPKTAQELWELIGLEGSVAEEKWPEYDPKLAVQAATKVVVQVNGKVRATLEILNVEAKYSEAAVLALALADEKVKKWVVGEVKKTVFVPGKLLSLVV